MFSFASSKLYKHLCLRLLLWCACGTLLLHDSFFFYLSFLSWIFTICNRAREGGGFFFNSSVPHPALQIRASQRSITANLWPLTALYLSCNDHCDQWIFQEIFLSLLFLFYFILNDFELVFLELLKIWNSFLFCAPE